MVGAPQIIAMEAQTKSGGAYIPPSLVNFYYARSAAYLPSMFLASPRLNSLSSALHPITSPGATGDGVPTFGLVLSACWRWPGLIVFWRRRTAWLFAVIWLGSAALALGTTLRIGNHVYLPLGQTWEGVKVSDIMPFTWFVQLPGMAGFRESARILMIGLPGRRDAGRGGRVLAAEALPGAARRAAGGRGAGTRLAGQFRHRA